LKEFSVTGTKNSNRNFLIFVFSFIFVTNALKPWIDFYTPIHYQLITLTQFVILLGFLTILSKKFYKSIDLLSFIFLSYIFIKLFFESFLYIYTNDITGLVSPIYVLLRSFLIVYLIRHLINNTQEVNFYHNLKLLLFFYLIVTLIYSILQYPLFFGNSIVSEYGGNSTSGNYFGIFRSNGGIGGTVIDYANFILAIGWVAFFAKFKNINLKRLFILLFLISSVFCFSRSLFLCIIFISTVMIINFSNSRRLFLSIIFISFFIIAFSYNFIFLYEGYSSWSGNSDAYRVSQWKDLFVDFSYLDYLVGKELGGNTGLFVTGERYKISGDGFITGFIYDAGLIGILLTLLILVQAILSMSVNLKVKICIFGSLILMLIINSGFEKLFIIFCYILAIGIVHGTNRNKNLINSNYA
tara:strand:- start:6539 stop:7774 length:1236 start_codon:yes stop_codon:yes gene_type:complete